ncbi:MAG: hypothetical protein ACUVRM_11600, partial [Bacillota bacterium]
SLSSLRVTLSQTDDMSDRVVLTYRLSVAIIILVIFIVKYRRRDRSTAGVFAAGTLIRKVEVHGPPTLLFWLIPRASASTDGTPL